MTTTEATTTAARTGPVSVTIASYSAAYRGRLGLPPGNVIVLRTFPGMWRYVLMLYRGIRRSGVEAEAARRLVWEVLFVAHCGDTTFVGSPDEAA